MLNHFFGNQFGYFSEKGYDFTVACTEDEELYKQAKEKGFKAFAIPILKAISPFQDLVSIIKLTRFIKKEKFPVVVAHSPKGGLIGMAAAYLAGVKKRVFFRHGVIFETATGFNRKMFILVEKLVGALATDVVIVSDSLKQLSHEYRLNAPAKSVLLGKGTCGGIDVDRFQHRSKSGADFVVGYVGRLVEDKGINELIAGWLRFAQEKSNVYLYIVGPWEKRNGISQDTFDIIRNNASIRFFDYVSDTAPLYQQMDVFILPSYREGFPISVLEASASGLPVITTRSTGCIDAIIENVTGIFTDITDVSISQAIEYYYKNPMLRKEHGNNGVKFVQDNFSENKLFLEIEEKVYTHRNI